MSTLNRSIGEESGAADARIASGGLVATVTGGPLLTISSLRYRGVELLSQPDALPVHYRVHGLRTGITLLHPWANRLGADHYACAGIEVHLDDLRPDGRDQDAGVRPGDPGEDAGAIFRDRNGLAIHGLAIPRSWTVVVDGTSSCFATAAYGALPAFPFPHRIDVRMTLAPADTLTVLTTLWPLGQQPVPIAFGWHPYFVCDRSERLELELPERLRTMSDERGLPTGAVEHHVRERFPLGEQEFDRGFCGLEDGATLVLDSDARSIRVVHDRGYPCAQLFAPADAPVVSLEPTTAPTDALRAGGELAFAAPRRPFTAQFTLNVRALSRTAAGM